MKNKIFATWMAITLAAASLAACGQSAPAAEPAAEAVAEETEEKAEAAEETVVEAVEEAVEETEETVGLPNPWHETTSADEAAQGAGLDGFDLVEDLNLSVGPEFQRVYRYMDGIAEVWVEFPASAITVRKGSVPDSDDISGDYNNYAHSWTQNIKGLEVNCYGNREGEATKTIWTLGDVSYSISAMGLGGDDDFGLNADDLASVINGLQ